MYLKILDTRKLSEYGRNFLITVDIENNLSKPQ